MGKKFMIEVRRNFTIWYLKSMLKVLDKTVENQDISSILWKLTVQEERLKDVKHQKGHHLNTFKRFHVSEDIWISAHQSNAFGDISNPTFDVIAEQMYGTCITVVAM
jgi:hypothetical protein